MVLWGIMVPGRVGYSYLSGFHCKMGMRFGHIVFQSEKPEDFVTLNLLDFISSSSHNCIRLSDCKDSRLFFRAHSSRGSGRLPLKEEITGSNPVCATKPPFQSNIEAKLSLCK